MNTLNSSASIIAGALAVMMIVVSSRVLKGNPVLDNPVIHVVVGVLTFVSLKYHPGGMIGVILLGYEAVAISILFLLLWRGFQKVRQSQFLSDLSRKIEYQIRRSSAQERNLQTTKRHDGHSQD